MNDFSLLGIRFHNYMKHKGLGVNKTAGIVGVSGSQISNITNGKVFGADKIFNILNIFKDLDANYLFTGEGEMIKNVTTNILIDHPDPLRDKLIVRQDQLIEKLEAENHALKQEVLNLKKVTKSVVYPKMVAESTEKLKKGNK